MDEWKEKERMHRKEDRKNSSSSGLHFCPNQPRLKKYIQVERNLTFSNVYHCKYLCYFKRIHTG